MKSETKTIVMYVLIALAVTGVVFGALYAMKPAKKSHHSHGDGTSHSH